MAKFCGKCGSALNETAIFCGGCGAKVPSATPAAFTSVQTGWAPVNSSSGPAPVTPTPDAAAFSPVPASFTPVAPIPTPEVGGFTPVPGSFAPTSPANAPVQTGWAPVNPSSGPAPVKPTPDAAAFSPVPASFTPVAPTPTPQVASFTPVPGSFAPTPPISAPAQTYPPAQPAYAPIPASYTGAPGVSAPGTAYPVAGAKKSNTLLKVVVAVVLLICVGSVLALAGLWYAAQKIKEKAHAAATQALAGNGPGSAGMNEFLKGVADLKGGSSNDGSAGGFKGDPCRFLSKSEVSQAVGIQVIRVDAKDEGCSYIAKGDPADVTSKHMASMIGGLGADAKTQKTIQQMAGGFFAQQEAGDKSLRAEAATGEIPVLVVSFTSGNAQAEMKMNRGAFGYVTGGQGTAASSGSGNLDGIGDEAYEAGGSMIIFRKGNSVAHFMYTSCPCNSGNIKPLAKLVASRM
jgi:hypothetical protein